MKSCPVVHVIKTMNLTERVQSACRKTSIPFSSKCLIGLIISNDFAHFFWFILSAKVLKQSCKNYIISCYSLSFQHLPCISLSCRRFSGSIRCALIYIFHFGKCQRFLLKRIFFPQHVLPTNYLNYYYKFYYTWYLF